MLFGFDLQQLFLFPIRDQEARKHFLIGCLVILAGFFIPIVPWLLVTGYNAILIRQVLQGEKPHMVPWQNWEALLKDGLRLYGIRLIYSSPLLVLLVPFFLMFFILPFIAVFVENGESPGGGWIPFFSVLASSGAILLVMPLSLALGLIVPAAEVHAVAKDDFMAGFQTQEWWAIFKKNWGGFVVALAIGYGIMMVMSFAMQIIFVTIVLICLIPLIMPAVSMYYMLVQYAAFARAYKDGKEGLSVRSAPA